MITIIYISGFYLPDPTSANNVWWSTFAVQFLKWKKCSREANIFFELVERSGMIFDEEENQPRLCSKSQTVCTWPLHNSRVIWSKHVDTHIETIFGIGVYLWAVGLGKDLKKFRNHLSVKNSEV